MRWQYWRWLLRGVYGQAPGLLSFFDRWLVLHIFVAISLCLCVDTSIKEAASTVLLPLASIFIGLSFAWAGNAQALMQTEEIEALSEYVTGGLQVYAYKFQTAILVILITLCAWGLAGLGVFDRKIFTAGFWEYVIKGILWFLASLTVRECWHVVLGSQVMLLSRYRIKKTKNRDK